MPFTNNIVLDKTQLTDEHNQQAAVFNQVQQDKAESLSKLNDAVENTKCIDPSSVDELKDNQELCDQNDRYFN
jgi:hypothetical protein